MQCVHTLFACMYAYVFVYACSFTMCVGIMYMHILYASIFVYMHALCVSVYACIVHMCMMYSVQVYMCLCIHYVQGYIPAWVRRFLSQIQARQAVVIMLPFRFPEITLLAYWKLGAFWSVSHCLRDLISPSFYPQKPTIHLAYIILEPPPLFLVYDFLTLWHCL